jgi:hypothetical protein
MLYVMVLPLAAQSTIAPPRHVRTDRVVTSCHLDVVTMQSDISTRSIRAQVAAPSQESIECNQITKKNNNVTIRTKIKATHRVDALNGRILSAVKCSSPLNWD